MRQTSASLSISISFITTSLSLPVYHYQLHHYSFITPQRQQQHIWHKDRQFLTCYSFINTASLPVSSLHQLLHYKLQF
jgi:hypothetical protein